jgi:uncharacterized protein YqeY
MPEENSNLRVRLKNDMVAAVKARDQQLTEILRFLIAVVDKRELQLPVGKMDEAEVVAALQKELKNKEESREMYEKAGRSEEVAKIDEEIRVLKTYLPEALSEEKLIEIIKEVTARVGNNFPLVMKEVIPQVKGRVDGGVVTAKVKEVPVSYTHLTLPTN